MSTVTELPLETLAKEYGLERLLAIDTDAFRAGLAAARGLSTRTERPEAVATEPAHTCRFRARGPRK